MFNLVSRAVGSILERLPFGNTSDSFQISEISFSSIKTLELVGNSGGLKLYKAGDAYQGVLPAPGQNDKLYLIFVLKDESTAKNVFANLSNNLEKIIGALPTRAVNVEKVQKISDAIREHPTFNCCHIACHLNLSNVLQDTHIIQFINEVDVKTGKTPLHVAVEAEKEDCVRKLLHLNVPYDRMDLEGQSPFHLAARCKNENILKLFILRDGSIVNRKNRAGETPVHEACIHGRDKNLETLLGGGGSPGLTESARLPIHCAVLGNSLSCVKALHRRDCELVYKKVVHSDNSVLHLARSKEMIHLLTGFGCSVEAINRDGDTPLAASIKRQDLSSTIGLLLSGARMDSMDRKGDPPMHVAIKLGGVDFVKLLVIFGADVNMLNREGNSPRHAAASSEGRNRHETLQCLHAVGARRCTSGMKDCSKGCSRAGLFDGKSCSGGTDPAASGGHIETRLDEFCKRTALDAAASRFESSHGDQRGLKKPGDRVLCLDGGGIRGLVSIKILMAIEQITGRPIRESFDWIGGTSTGGILTMGIILGKSLNYIMGSYFCMKDEVFQGSRPYKSEALEGFLKREFGVDKTMTHVQKPRVLLTTVVTDRLPAELFMYRNYELPGVEHDPVRSPFPGFLPFPLPRDQLIWQALRATSAAPTYFEASGRLVDGGLVANNPTLDVLTEVHKFNVAHRASGSVAEVFPLHVVVSIGTGKIPQKFVENSDVFRPTGFAECVEFAFGAKNLIEHLIDLVTQSEGQAVNRAASWCNMLDVPFFRLNPQLSDDVPLDCTDDSTLVNVLWETQCYLFKNHDKLVQLANLLMP